MVEQGSRRLTRCPKCGLQFRTDTIVRCVECGTELQESAATEPTDGTVTLHLDFTVTDCEQCRTPNPYALRRCRTCGADLSVGEGPAEAEDPCVAARSVALAGLAAEMSSLTDELRQLGKTRGSAVISDEHAYLQAHVQCIERVVDAGAHLRVLLEATDLSADSVSAPGFQQPLELLRRAFGDLASAVAGGLTLSAHPAWSVWHEHWTGTVLELWECYAATIGAATAPDPATAVEAMALLTARFDELVQSLRWSPVVFAGKRLRYGQATDMPALFAQMASEGMSLGVLADTGREYFRSALLRDTSELPAAHALTLGVFAILAESTTDQHRLLRQARAVAGALRRADSQHRAAMLSVVPELEVDLVRADQVLAEVSELAGASLMCLSPQAAGGQALHIYQRLAEGCFKSLLNILLYAVRLGKGRAPDYARISRQKFGDKVNELRQHRWHDLSDVADGLEMSLRHADAHCRYTLCGNTVHVEEVDERTGAVIGVHSYRIEELVVLIQRLFETVLSMQVGIRLFQTEQFEIYTPPRRGQEGDTTSWQTAKLLCAVYGILVQTADPGPSCARAGRLEVVASLAPGLGLTPERLLIPISSLCRAAPDAIELHLLLVPSDGGTGPSLNLSLPTTYYHRRPHSQRALELGLLELRYRTMSLYASPPQALWGDRSSAEMVYLADFLKPVAVYLLALLGDCRELADDAAAWDMTRRSQLAAEALLLQRMLASNPAPATYAAYHESAAKATRGALAFARAAAGGRRPDRRQLASAMAQMLPLVEQMKAWEVSGQLPPPAA